MKGFEKLLFFYSIIAVTAVMITYGVFSPMPQNLIASVILLPIGLYFWLRFTSPGNTTVNLWSFRLLIVVVAVSALGIYAGFFSRMLNKPKDETEVEKIRSESQAKIDELEAQVAKLEDQVEDDAALADELSQIKDELTRLSAEGKLSLNSQSESLADILGNLDENENNPTPTEQGYVSIKNSFIKELDVLSKPEFSSSRIGTIKYGTVYPYSQYQDNWYKITLANGKEGWVHERDVTVSSDL